MSHSVQGPERHARIGVVGRSIVSASVSLSGRRMRRDAGLVATWVALVALAIALAIAIPHRAQGTIDDGAREAVASAGTDADVVVRAGVGDPDLSGLMQPDDILRLEDGLAELLPPTLSAVATDVTATVLSPPGAFASTEGQATVTSQVQLAMLTPTLADRLTVNEGSLPTDQEGNLLDVVVSAAVAEAASLRVGSVLAPPTGELSLQVVGIIEPADAADAVWTDIPSVWQPSRSASGVPGFTVFAAPGAVERAEVLFTDPFDAAVRIAVDPSAFTFDRIAAMNDEIHTLQANSSVLTADVIGEVRVTSGFGDALDSFPREARAATAQMSVVVTGVLGILIAVILVLARLIVGRRASEIALERSRGASVLSVGFRQLVESVVTVAFGVALGIVAASFLVPGAARVTALVAVTAVVAVFAPTAQAVRIARASGATRRQAANRRDRQELIGRRRVQRIVIESAVVLVAVAALYSVRSRGLFGSRLAGIDPFLVAAPLLLAVAITIVIARVFPLVVRAASALGSRQRGALGILGAMQAGRGVPVLPVFALTLAIGVAVTGGLLVDSVRGGQDDASWQRIGADVRVEGPVTQQTLDRVSAAPGVDAVGSTFVTSGIEVTGAPAFVTTTLVAVDPGYADVVVRLPDTGIGTSRGDLARLGATSATGPLLAVTDSALAARLGTGELALRYDQQRIPLAVIGVEDAGPRGYEGGSFLYVDLDALAARLDVPIVADRLLVMGAGAAASVEALDDPDHETLDRAVWLADRRSSAIVGGVTDMIALSGVAAGLVALVMLIASVLSGSRSRGLSIALLRTLGLRARLGGVLMLAEVGPIVLAALLGGVAAGIGIVVAVGPSLGLGALAGGIGDPVLRISGQVIGAVVAGVAVLLVVAVAAELLAYRRDRLSEVLRVGETQ